MIAASTNNRDLIKNSWKTIMEMLEDRQIICRQIDPNVFQNIIEKSSCKPGFIVILDVISDKKNLSIKDEKIKIVYYMSNKFKLAEFKELYKEKGDFYLNLLIVMDTLSITNQKMITNLNKNIEYFLIKTLSFNITRHELQPKFRKIDDSNEITELLQTYSAKTKTQLPWILKTDAIAKYYGLKSGDIVEVKRKSETSGEYTCYRYCS